MTQVIEKQRIDLGVLPTKGIDYWTPEEAEEMNNAKNGALVAAQEARTAKQETDAATVRANEAATNANGAAGVAREEAGKAERSATNADDATVNANRAAADANRAYNTVTNYHDNVTIPDHQTAESDHTRANTDHSTAVTDHQTANTDHTNVTTNWRKEFTDAQDARAAEFNRTQQEKQTEFERTQAEKQAIFDADHNRAENDHNTLAGGMVVKIQDLMGLYTDREPLTLTAAYSGKAIVAPRGAKLGSLTDYPGASVSVEYSVTRGDMLLIKPGKTSNDYFTVAQVTEQNGVKLYEKVMSLNEMAEVPTDGYLRFLVMPSDMVIVVTFFAQEAAFDQTIRVMRCGAFATISTQVGNIYADLTENYAKAQGYYRDLHCGVADSLGADPSKTYTEIIPCGRPLGNAGSLTDGTGGSHSPESIGEVSTVEMKEIEGDCFGGNQMVDKSRYNFGTPASVGLSISTNDDGSFTINGTATSRYERKFASTQKQSTPNHSYLLMGSAIGSSQTGYRLEYVNSGATPTASSADLGDGVIFKATLDASIDVYVDVKQGISMNGEKFTPLVLDLTLLFPTPSGQAFVATLRSNDTPKVLDRLGFFAFMSES